MDESKRKADLSIFFANQEKFIVIKYKNKIFHVKNLQKLTK